MRSQLGTSRKDSNIDSLTTKPQNQWLQNSGPKKKDTTEMTRMIGLIKETKMDIIKVV